MTLKVDSAPPVFMQAVFLYGVRDMRQENCRVPVPEAGEVLLKIVSVGVCGSDVHFYTEGRIGNRVVQSPILLGHEFSAQVVALGEGVDRLKTGQLVAVDPAISCGKCEQCRSGNPNLCPEVRFCGTPPVNGVFAEYSVMPARNCFPLPPSVSAAEGALLEPLGIALHAVNLAHLKVGDNVAVLGAGPIGLLIAAVAKASGAGTVWMTEPLAYRRSFAKGYTGAVVLDPQTQNPAEEIRRLSGGRGADVVFEAAGAPETPQQAVEIVRIGGKVILAGIPADDSLVFQASIVRRKGLTMKMVRRMKHTYPTAIHLVEEGQIDLKSLVTHRLPLSAASEAMDMLANYRDGVIKALIVL